MGITKNASLKDIARKLMWASDIIIFVHQNPDGDALGSSTALAKTLRGMGKTAYVLLEEEVPGYLSFMDTDCCTLDRNCIADPDVCICVDCCEYSRFASIADIYDKGKTKLCVDHHLNDTGFGDFYYVDSTAAASAELIYKLIVALDEDITRDIANALYIGISTDTGSFKYSNTTADTHEIAMNLLRVGIDHNDIIVNLYQNKKITEVEVQSMAVNEKKMIAGGKGAITMVTAEMLESCNADLGDAESVIDVLRDISGVEIAAVLKERGDKIKVSFRAKSYANVAEIAQKFGGGGHVKAAGCTLECGKDEALAKIEASICEALK